MANVHDIGHRYRTRRGRRERPNPHRLYRDPDHAILAGVCAGVAKYFGWSRLGVRAVVILSLFTGFMIPFVAIAYVAMAVLLPKQPEQAPLSDEQLDFWRGVSSAPSDAAGALRHRFRDLDLRLQRMEAHVTSAEFRFDRELGRRRS